uniref:ERCC4 domain-containing protein n=1 Tax=Syphacia muris TaxID=451379 RepID=A0A0N5ARY7_9BILA
MSSSKEIKCEIFSDDEGNGDEGSDDDIDNEEGDDDDDGRIELLEFERNVMLDTFTDDVLFVLAKGLALERLILHHLHLYSDQNLLIFVINTTQYDEVFFLSKLKNAKCPPKIITSDIGIKERENLYLEGGVQFITSRILMVDLLQDRVPVKNVAGIIVHRAHQLLTGFQESFILRLYREKKSDGFVKAFTDNVGVLNSMGVLQRLVNRLYVRRVRLLPRFDVDVKRILDLCSPTLIELYSDLPLPMRRIQSALMDIIRTCLKELKQSVNIEVSSEEEVVNSSTGLVPTSLEIQLKTKQLLLTEKQQRLLFDLRQLRHLLFEAEELDPIALFKSLTSLRSDKDQVSKNSGWLFTQTASKLFAESESICKLRKKEEFVILVPPKWSSLKKVLQEIHETIEHRRQSKINVAPVLLIASSPDVCTQLKDLIKYGPNLLKWIKFREVMTLLSINKCSPEPQQEPLWDPTQIVLFASSLDGEKRSDVFNSVKIAQKAVAQKGKKRRKAMENELKRKKVSEKSGSQTSLIQFGIVHYTKSRMVSNI